MAVTTSHSKEAADASAAVDTMAAGAASTGFSKARFVKRVSSTLGLPYYYDTQTGESTWERPDQYVEEWDMKYLDAFQTYDFQPRTRDGVTLITKCDVGRVISDGDDFHITDGTNFYIKLKVDNTSVKIFSVPIAKYGTHQISEKKHIEVEIDEMDKMISKLRYRIRAIDNFVTPPKFKGIYVNSNGKMTIRTEDENFDVKLKLARPQTRAFFELLVEIIQEWKEIAYHVIHETGRTTKRAIA